MVLGLLAVASGVAMMWTGVRWVGKPAYPHDVYFGLLQFALGTLSVVLGCLLLATH